MTRQEAKDAILLLITDPTNNQNTAAKVREALDVIIDSATNNEDDGVTPTSEVVMTATEIDPPPFSGPLFLAQGDAALGRSFFLDVNTLGGILLEIPSNLKVGETYTFIFLQSADTGTVTLRSGFRNQLGFNMVTGDGNFSMFHAYCHEINGDKYLMCFPQQDFS